MHSMCSDAPHAIEANLFGEGYPQEPRAQCGCGPGVPIKWPLLQDSSVTSATHGLKKLFTHSRISLSQIMALTTTYVAPFTAPTCRP